MKESSKSLRRRWVEHETGVFPWRDLFQGYGLDVGAGDDPLPFENCQPFDKDDGDANHLSAEFLDYPMLSYIHASQCLEHLHDAEACLRDWLTLLAHGGHLIFTVPDVLIYEGWQWPSKYNSDHKSTWSMIYHGSPCPNHIHIPTLLSKLEGIEVKLARLVDTNYDYSLGTSVDQTFVTENMVEAWNEVVIMKL